MNRMLLVGLALLLGVGALILVPLLLESEPEDALLEDRTFSLDDAALAADERPEEVRPTGARARGAEAAGRPDADGRAAPADPATVEVPVRFVAVDGSRVEGGSVALALEPAGRAAPTAVIDAAGEARPRAAAGAVITGVSWSRVPGRPAEFADGALTLPAARVAAAGMEPIEVRVERGLTVSGTVRDATTREPLAYVAVKAARGDAGFGRTDARGRFDLVIAAAAVVDDRGRGALLFTRPGYARHVASFAWGRGAPAPVLDVELRPAARLHGRVLDAQAAPVEGADILVVAHAEGERIETADGVMTARGGDLLAAWSIVRSDAEGRFEAPLEDAVSRIELHVRKAGLAPVRVAVEPTRTDPIEIRLPISVTLAVRALDAAGAAVPGGVWTLMTRSDDLLITGRADAEGRLHVDVPAGAAVELVGVHHGAALRGERVHQVGTEDEALDLPLQAVERPPLLADGEQAEALEVDPALATLWEVELQGPDVPPGDDRVTFTSRAGRVWVPLEGGRLVRVLTPPGPTPLRIEAPGRPGVNLLVDGAERERRSLTIAYP